MADYAYSRRHRHDDFSRSVSSSLDDSLDGLRPGCSGAFDVLHGIFAGTEENFLRDFGTGFIIIITMLMAIFLGASLVPPEIERRTIFTILSKPVERHEFLIGKFLGLCMTLLVNLFVLSVMFLISFALFKIRREGWADALASTNISPGLGFDLVNFSKALCLQFGQLTILSALSLLLSLVVSNITAIVFSFVVYFGGQMSSFWEHLSGQGGQGGDGHDHGEESGHVSRSMQGVINIVYFLLPRLDRFDVRERLVQELPIHFNYMWKAFGSGLVYSAVLLTIAYLVFSEREF
jgi:ABC-type transport system involved in multi-copper enzyme maturation permease subunit